MTDNAATMAAVAKDLKQGLEKRIAAAPPFFLTSTICRARDSTNRKSLFICSSLSARYGFGSLKIAQMG